MTNKPNFEPQSEGDAILLTQAETDAFLDAVNEQIMLGSFDANDHEVLKRMVESLGDTRGMVRLGFAEALGKIGKPATPMLIEGLLNHSNPVVRRACGKTLTLIADPTAVPSLLHALINDEDTVVKGSVVGALARSGEAAVPALLQILASPEHPESTKGHAAWALSFMGAEVKDLLYKEIDSDVAEVRCAVVGAIANIARDHPDEQLFQVLIDSLNDTDANVRIESASTLGKLAYQPAIPQLVELLDHSDWETRKSAALALMKIGDRSVLDTLQLALSKESEVAVQQIIKLAISQLERL